MFVYVIFADNAGVIVNPKGEMKGINQILGFNFALHVASNPCNRQLKVTVIESVVYMLFVIQNL